MRKEDAANRAKLKSEENGTVDEVEIEKLDKEGAKRKAECLKKEMQLQQQIVKLQAVAHFMPIGQDRAFR